jgi:phage-related minor tail protein
MAKNTIKGLTVEIGGDTTKLGKALEDVEKKSRDLSSELGQINKLLKMDPGNTDLLAQKQGVLANAVSNTKEKLDKLKEAEKQVQQQFERGEVSEEQVRALQREIIETTNKLGTYERAVKETAEQVEKLGKKSEDAGDDVDELGDDVEDTADEFDKLGKKSKDSSDDVDELGDDAKDTAKDLDKAGDEASTFGDKVKAAGSVAVKGFAVVGAAVTAAVGALVASAEASRDYRREMGKLDTAFTTAGHSSETAKQTYQALQGVLGETDQAVEAANHLAKLTTNEKDLEKWTNICTGVYATFGASLPIEGLTEAANETAKTGQLTGGLADALNWAGVSEEGFQARLDACSTEQERQTLIMTVLNNKYAEAAEQYKETNAEVIRANEANEAWASSMAEVGGAVEPLLTDIKLLGASILSDLVPGVKEVTGAFRNMLNGDEGAAADLGEALSGIISQLLKKVTDIVPAMAEMAMSLVTTLTTTLLHSLPDIVRTLVDVAVQAVNALAAYLPALLPAIATAVFDLVSQLVNSIPAIMTALMGVINGILLSLPKLLDTFGTRILEIIVDLLYGVLPGLVTIFTEVLPQMLTSLLTIMTEYLPWLIESLVFVIEDIVTQLLPQVVTLLTEALPTLIETLVTGLVGFIPVLLDAAISLLNAIVQAVPVIIQELIPVLPTLINTILNALIEAIPVLLDAAIELLFAILDAIPVLLDALIPALPVIIDTVINAVIGALPILLDAAVKLLMALVQAIPKIIGPLTQQLPTIISTITSTLGKNLPTLISAAVKLFLGIVEAIPKIVVELGKQLPSIITAIVKGLASGVSSIASVGTDLIKGLWNGIKDMTSWITGKLKGFGDSILSGIKSFFGIHSPSRVFKDEVGKMLAVGLAEGIEDNADQPLDAMADLSNGILGEAGDLNGLTLERRLQHTFAAPETISAAESGMLSTLDKILAAIERGQIIAIDGDKLIGATVDAMNSALGQRRVLAERGAI